MRAIFLTLAAAVMCLATDAAFAQEVSSSGTVLLVPAAQNEQFEGVEELSLVTAEGKVHPCNPELGDRIELMMIDLDLWLRDQKKHITAKDVTQGADLIEAMLPRMVLVLDGKAMTTLHATRPSEDPLYVPAPDAPADAKPATGRWFSVQFELKRHSDNQESKADWQDILKQSGISLPMEVTLGIIGDDGKTIYGCPTNVLNKDGAPLADHFTFRRVPWDGWTIAFTILLFATLVFFIYLALTTCILRDPAQPIRPDGLPPWSLGRCQMAFWFFLVAIAFVFLWVLTGRGDLDTISDSTIGLLGISAATALGSALVTSKYESTPTVNYRADIADAKEKLLTRKSDRARIAKSGNADQLKTIDEQIEQAKAELCQIEAKLDAYRRANPRQFFTDLLSDDGNIVTFNRFQIIVWTLVLGVIFTSEVLTRLAMPTFSSTLLLLMGISSGTYVGFRFTPDKPNTSP